MSEEKIIRIHLGPSPSRWKIAPFVTAAFLALNPLYLGSEQPIPPFVTYYPAPYGNYYRIKVEQYVEATRYPYQAGGVYLKIGKLSDKGDNGGPEFGLETTHGPLSLRVNQQGNLTAQIKLIPGPGSNRIDIIDKDNNTGIDSKVYIEKGCKYVPYAANENTSCDGKTWLMTEPSHSTSWLTFQIFDASDMMLPGGNYPALGAHPPTSGNMLCCRLSDLQ